MSKLNLEGAELTLTGVADGQDVTIKGKVKNVRINVEHSYDRYRSVYGIDKIVRDDARYSLQFDNDSEGVAYTLQVKGIDVNRTARIEASDRTAAAIEKARVRVGAPENAKFRMGDFARMDGELVIQPVDKPHPIMVEFYWKETVYR